MMKQFVYDFFGLTQPNIHDVATKRLLDAEIALLDAKDAKSAAEAKVMELEATVARLRSLAIIDRRY